MGGCVVALRARRMLRWIPGSLRKPAQRCGTASS